MLAFYCLNIFEKALKSVKTIEKAVRRNQKGLNCRKFPIEIINGRKKEHIKLFSLSEEIFPTTKFMEEINLLYLKNEYH